MVRENVVAQATSAPNNGASNASDFQPPTRNPQTGELNTQQQTSEVQETGDQQLLNNPNAHIEVPVNPADRSYANGTPPRGINWPAVIVIAVVLVVIAEFIIRKREKKLARFAPSGSDPDASAATSAEPEVTEPPRSRKNKKKKAGKHKKK